MSKRILGHVRSNVIGYVALFVMLGGAAYALPGRALIDKNDLRRNVVKPRNIKGGAVTTAKLANRAVTTPKLANGAVTTAKLANNAATGAKVNEGSLNFTCTSGRTQFNDLCYETALRPTANWETAFTDCENEGGQLPSLAELAAADDTLGFTGATPDLWAGQNWDDGGTERASALDFGTGIPQRQAASGNHQYVCAFPLLS